MSERRHGGNTAAVTWTGGAHGRLGLRYLVAVTVSLALGGVLGLFLTAEAGWPHAHLVPAEQFHVLFTLHGVIMVLLVLLPLIPAALANLVVPDQAGADGAAASWAGNLGFACHVAGALLVLATMVLGGADTGWTFAVPGSLRSSLAVTPLAVGASLLAAAAWCNALGLVATLARRRRVAWADLPATATAVWFTGWALLIALPLLAGALLLVAAGRLGPLALLDPAAGGDPERFAALFWAGAHPALFLMLLPALGVVSDVLQARSRQAPRRGLLAGAFAAIAALTLVGWGWHLLGGAVADETQVVLGGLSLLVVIPVVTVVGVWLEALAAGTTRTDAALVHAAWAVLAVTGAALGTLLIGSPAAGPLLRGTLFETALVHYLALGGVLTAALAGLYHWWPRLTGRAIGGGRSVTGAVLLGLGVNLACGSQLLAGARGAPARLHELAPAGTAGAPWLVLGTLVLAAGLALVVMDLLVSLRRPAPSAAD